MHARSRSDRPEGCRDATRRQTHPQKREHVYPRCRRRTTPQRRSTQDRPVRRSAGRAEHLQALHRSLVLPVRHRPTRGARRRSRRDASLAGRTAPERGWRTRLRSRLSRVSGHMPDLHRNARRRLQPRPGRRGTPAGTPSRKPHRTVGLDRVVKVVTLLCRVARASLSWSAVSALSLLASAATNADRASTCDLTVTRAKCVTSISQLLRVANARSLRGLVRPVYHPRPDPLARLEHRSRGRRATNAATVGAARV